MKSSISERVITTGGSYQSSESCFINNLLILAKGFPWNKFLLFFREKDLVSCDAEYQVFLLRLLALQELLHLDDKALLKWIQHQFQLIAFLHLGYKVALPSLQLLKEFRTTLEVVGILAPFKKRCQKLIALQQQRLEKQDKKINPDVSTRGSQRVIGIKTDESDLDKETTWIACPVCKSQNINKVLPPHWMKAQEVEWCRCRFCGNKFQVASR